MESIFPSLTLLTARPGDTAAAGAMMAGCMGVYLIFVLAIMIFFVFCFWRIFTKAGYPGALALLALIPGLGGIIMICILAFGNWPVLKDR